MEQKLTNHDQKMAAVCRISVKFRICTRSRELSRQEMAAKQLGCSGGIADLLSVIGEEKDASKVYVLFCGEPDESGESWCPDCVKAEPVVEECVKKITDPSVVFIMCSVGDKPTWKDSNNEFRTNSKTSLKAVPTLLLWESPKRLVEDECANKDLVEMFFEED